MVVGGREGGPAHDVQQRPVHDGLHRVQAHLRAWRREAAGLARARRTRSAAIATGRGAGRARAHQARHAVRHHDRLVRGRLPLRGGSGSRACGPAGALRAARGPLCFGERSAPERFGRSRAAAGGDGKRATAGAARARARALGAPRGPALPPWVGGTAENGVRLLPRSAPPGRKRAGVAHRLGRLAHERVDVQAGLGAHRHRAAGCGRGGTRFGG